MKGTLVIVFSAIICVVVAFLGDQTKYCAPGDLTQGCHQCPVGKEWFDCDVDPCVREEEFGCPLHKNSNPKCISNQCGGCQDMWFLPNGQQVWCWGP